MEGLFLVQTMGSISQNLDRDKKGRRDGPPQIGGAGVCGAGVSPASAMKPVAGTAPSQIVPHLRSHFGLDGADG